VIIVSMPEITQKQDVKSLIATNIPLNIVFEDDFLLVINKDGGLVVHPGDGEDNEKTLVNGLLYKYGIEGLSTGENPSRPGIVHRLDKDTSGLMIVCKKNDVHTAIKQQFQDKVVQKWYHAIVIGKMKEDHGTINRNIMRHPKIHHKMTITDNPQQGKPATTEYRLMKYWQTKSCYYSLLELKLHSGRTHQIRVHLSSLSHPIVGDVLYHKKKYKTQG